MIERELKALFIDRAGDQTHEENVTVAIESSYSLIINKDFRINVVASPEHLEDLATGYLISEGIIHEIADIKSIKLKNDQVLVDLAKKEGDAALWFEIRSSGCVGIKLQYENLGAIVKSDLAIPAKKLCAMQEALLEQSHVWRATGGCHIAGVFTPDGTLLHVAEDVGRHNAVDKVIGMSARAGEDREQLVLATSGRLAGGMVAKVARAGFPIVLSKAAPLDAGIALAQQVGLTLCAFVRGDKMNVYTHPRRVLVGENR